MSMDFYGFSFRGVHSSELGFVRTSDGSRYSETLVPDFQDKTIVIPGGDGTYFFESYYTQKPFSINIAFDSMTEVQFRRLRQVFNGKDVGPLIYDESPYKAYIVKTQGAPQLKYICFDETNSNKSSPRIYKGEGSISFVAYAPYAHSVHKFFNEYSDSNKYEWYAASGLLASQTTAGITYDDPSEYINVYNPGDMPTDFKLYFPTGELHTRVDPITLQRIGGVSDPTNLGTLNVRPITQLKDSNDAYIRIDTKTNLIEGYSSTYEPTGTLYNDYIQSGDFFKIPVSEPNTSLVLHVWPNCSLIQYHYLYY